MKISLLLATSLTTLALTSKVAGAQQPYWCDRAQTQTEHSICQSEGLWCFDQRINQIYVDWQLRDRSLPPEQRAWLRLRDQCGYDVGCIADRYTARIAELEGRYGLGRSSCLVSSEPPSATDRPGPPQGLRCEEMRDFRTEATVYYCDDGQFYEG